MALAAPEQGRAQEEERLVLPSGLEAELQEVITGEAAMGLTVRFRFVAEGFTGAEDFEAQTADLEYLCNDFALERIDMAETTPDRVVISLADRPSQFGQFDPDVAQIFESFSIADAACILELF
ncbi:hypothetical protein XM53_11590 [Roseovarius atlanticus]|uniref:Acetolactate synthase n=2 Tax=Roseovarius atlanticus TaxID=1641875 RepID=A0A0T5NU03_9RHOB|nr:hypothetical protein XM53_11590 [Roseovarius atlanticus]